MTKSGCQCHLPAAIGGFGDTDEEDLRKADAQQAPAAYPRHSAQYQFIELIVTATIRKPVAERRRALSCRQMSERCAFLATEHLIWLKAGSRQGVYLVNCLGKDARRAGGSRRTEKS
ncbi:MAG: hypothetical protein ABJB10_04945 [Mesorhizobium sp.]